MQRMKRKGTVILAGGLLILMAVFAGVADAALVQRTAYVGNYGLSTDGFGNFSNSGTISAFVPSGATVVKAYLYSATNGQSATLGDVSLGGTGVTFFDQWTNDILPTYPNYFRTGISDVTSIVKPSIDSGAGGTYNFSVTESLGNTDGEALVVIYSLASLPTATVAILDGKQALAGDSFSANFASPLDPTEAGFFAEMRLGDSFSYPDQSSNVTVNGTLISAVAGGYDDGVGGGGSLITVGGNDDPFSTLLPAYADDHERYNLVPYITLGDTSIAVDTINPSNDDNIFLAAFYLHGIAGINEPPPPPPNGVPEPGTLLLLGSGLIGLVGYRRTKRMM